LAALLFSLLAGAGMGGLWSKKLSMTRMTRGIALASLGVTVIVLGYNLILPLIFDRLLGLSFVMRIAVAVVLVVPLGFFMGIPFPLGIQMLKEIQMEHLIPWMWGINGLGSVWGSTFAIAVSIRYGFMEALIAGAASYFVVFLFFRSPVQSDSAKGSAER
jgi:hypothetical protein